MPYTEWMHLENSAGVLEVWQWDQQWVDVYRDILKMAVEYPQKQYRNGQDDDPICIIVSSQEQGIYLLHPLLFSKQEFVTLAGANKKKPPQWFIKLIEQLWQARELQDETCWYSLC